MRVATVTAIGDGTNVVADLVLDAVMWRGAALSEIPLWRHWNDTVPRPQRRATRVSAYIIIVSFGSKLHFDYCISRRTSRLAHIRPSSSAPSMYRPSSANAIPRSHVLYTWRGRLGGFREN